MRKAKAPPVPRHAWRACESPHRLVAWSRRVANARRFLLLACAIVRNWPGGVRSDLGRRVLSCIEDAVPLVGPPSPGRLVEQLLSPRFPGTFQRGEPPHRAISDEGHARMNGDQDWVAAFIADAPNLRSATKSLPNVLIDRLTRGSGTLHSQVEQEVAAEVAEVRKGLTPRPRLLGLVRPSAPSEEQVRDALLARLATPPARPEPSLAAVHAQLFGERARQRRSEFRQLLCELVREVFGDPFRPWQPRPEWLAAHDGAARALTEDITRRGDFGAMPVLGDALEEAGCTDDAALEHCRGGGPHARGCWVLDALLNMPGPRAGADE